MQNPYHEHTLNWNLNEFDMSYLSRVSNVGELTSETVAKPVAENQQHVSVATDPSASLHSSSNPEFISTSTLKSKSDPSWRSWDE